MRGGNRTKISLIAGLVSAMAPTTHGIDIRRHRDKVVLKHISRETLNNLPGSCSPLVRRARRASRKSVMRRRRLRGWQ